MAAEAADWLTRPIRTQRHLPKSVVHIVEMALLHLASIVHDPQVSPTQRQMAICLLLTAPRWLWPESAKPPNGRLPAQARPRLIRSRAELVMQNRWAELAPLLLPSEAPPLVTSTTPTPQQPGLITGLSAHKLMQAARHGGSFLVSAWLPPLS